MADNRRAGERTIFRGDVEGNDTLAEISTALETERRAPMAVGAGFVPPAGGQASNIPAMADLEDELLREFALYEGPRETTVRETPRKIEPSFAPVSRPAPAPVAAPVSVEDDDDTMPPVDAGSLFRAAPPAPIVRTPAASAPTVSPSRIDPKPPAVFAAEPDAVLNVSPTAGDEPAADAESVDTVAFDGPVPDLPDWDLDDVVAVAEPVVEPVLDNPADGAVDDFAADGDPVFAGPVPEIDFDDEPVFSGPVPEVEPDNEPAAFGEEPVFAGPVPDFDFSDEDLSVAAEAGEPETSVELEDELEQSLGALDLAPEVAVEPASPFAAWKNDRLAAVETTTPAWLSAAVIAPKSVPLTDDVSEVAAAVVSADLSGDALTGGHVGQTEEETAAEVVPETDPLGELVFELNENDLVMPDFSKEAAAVVSEVGAAEAESLVSAVDEAEQVAPEPYVSVEPERPASAPGSVALAATSAVAAPSVAVDPVFEMPDWLQSARGLQAPVEPVAEKNVDFDFKDFEFDFDEDAIEAEVSRAVMSELQANTAPPPADEAPFDPTAITEIEDRMPASFGNIHVPQVPDQEGESLPKPVSDFDYDIEAEMAELFAMGNKSKAQAADVETASDLTSADASDADGMTNELIRSIHEAPAIPAGRAFDIAEINAASTSFVSRYARVAAFAAIVAFAGLGAVMLWRSGEVKSVIGEGAPRVIMADKSPVKEVPDEPGGKQVPNQDKAVYDRVSGKAPEVVKQGSLIANSEEPVNVAAKTLGDEGAPPPDAQAPGVSDASAAGDADARLPATPAQAGSDGQKLNESVTPRKVKTMIVLPNGTLVARETNAPADQAATQKTSAADAAMTAPAASAKVEASQPAAAIAPANGTPSDAASAAQGNQQAADKNVLPKTAAMPIPTARPAEQPVNVVGTVTQRGNVVGQQPAASEKPAALAPTAKPAPQPAVASNAPAGAYVIQIASLPSEAEAQKSYANLSAKFSSVIGGKTPDIKPAEIPGKGTYYRLRIVAGSKDEAIALCTRYKAAGGSCLVSR
ncbi:MAG TPA: SPOR domain-containing protein [Ensifer sp.]|nr:SPOR domain-containing protein [Ensifer sp.]